ncbi:MULTISPECIES: DedA family protein [Dyadobacter]|uniref:Membrane-associated protein n=2 Tax=Dyadobacter TaxID=120831 RepID=A0A2P8GFM1_9BACT|nr:MULTISPECIES: DedA family protein [Dyadobacter]MBZ1358726.1 DedA family protein [Dyadobacter fermentans]MDR6803400.1 membrane-associated protein [Dyadobacter fermentans]MDR7041141.1 membrane-associated protein [Dyadobacter sp. BE242]MDR7195544.1 membrane-associated protein [Dyadobacter sp. BE34]MDR7213911.1 membrane-associated protein [Dyadobacter sp. BE31]
MEFLTQFIDFFLHLDKHLFNIVEEYGTLTYVILFLIVFTETGLVIMPLLPGDSLLFAAGAIAANETTGLNVWLIIIILIIAALLGDNVNYFMGKTFGGQIKKREKILFLKREYLEKTEAFYEKHGGSTVIMARFIPIVRTVAPFVAGAGSMNYSRYIVFCIVGALLWVPTLTLLGYFFGNMEIVKKNFELVIFGIIGISILPMIFSYLKSRFAKPSAA